MEHSTPIMKMTNPNDASDFWDQVFSFGKVVAPWATVGWGLHQLINKVFKYFSDGRDAELRAIVKAEMKPELERVNQKVDEMDNKLDAIQKSLWELNKKS